MPNFAATGWVSWLSWRDCSSILPTSLSYRVRRLSGIMSKFVILDRDGVINEDSDAYIKSPDEWVPVPGSLEGIALLTRGGFRVVVLTNQSGIARGLFDLPTLEAIHQKMCSAVESLGGRVEDIFFCPHGPEDGCDCRKPE